MTPTITVIEALRNSLTAAARFNRADMVAPAAILWTDADSGTLGTSNILSLANFEKTRGSGNSYEIRGVRAERG